MFRTTLATRTHRPAWVNTVLVWLLLTFTVALASPLVHPKSIELLCTGTGSVKLLIGGSDDADTAASMAPDCALCAQASAPPPNVALHANALHNLVYALQPTAQLSSAVWRTAPPLPARGPPSAPSV
jgi:hypothetical protein